MTLPSCFDHQGSQFAWDSTSLKDAFACPRLYFYTMIGQYSDGQSSVHLIFGGLYAKALETYHKLTVIDGATHDEALRSVVRATMVESWVHNLDANKERRPGTERDDGIGVVGGIDVDGHGCDPITSSRRRRHA